MEMYVHALKSTWNDANTIGPNTNFTCVREHSWISVSKQIFARYFPISLFLTLALSTFRFFNCQFGVRFRPEIVFLFPFIRSLTIYFFAMCACVYGCVCERMYVFFRFCCQQCVRMHLREFRILFMSLFYGIQFVFFVS